VAGLTVRNIPEKDTAGLRHDAKQNRGSINAEVLSLLADEAAMNRRQAAKAMIRIDKIQEEIARKYPHQLDSVGLIREDRDTR
jgi:plasmid stability protein